MLKGPISRAFVLAGACLLAITPFFWWGSPSGHDFEFHMFSWMEVLSQWKHAIVYPRWAALANWGYGEARFLFYPPASWTLGAALGATLPWGMVPGAFCWIALTLAGAAMYRLAREWLPAPAALFAAVFYALNPYHLLIVYWRSAYAELLAAALLPLLLLCLLRLNDPVVGPPDSAGGREPSKSSRSGDGHDFTACGKTQGFDFALKGRGFSRAVSTAKSIAALAADGNYSLSRQHRFRPALWLGLLLAAAWLTNVPAAVMIHYSTAGLALLLAAMGAARETRRQRSWSPQIWRPLVRTLVGTALAMLLGAGLASFYLLPAIYEQGWVNLSQVLSPGVRPQDNFLFTTIPDPDHNRFNLLVSTVALTEIGVLALAIWFSRRWPKKQVGTAVPQPPWMLLSVWGVGSAILMLSVSNLLWQHLPKFRFVQLPFRWLLCMNAALAMLLTMAAKRWTSRLLASAVLLAALILAGYRIQPPWWDTASDIQEMSDALADGTGYEGTDEYVPAGADAYELNKNLPRISDDTGAPVQSEMLAWAPAEKHFIVHAPKPVKLELRLFNYPAWQISVNGQPAPAQTTEVTGQMIIPILAGTNDVRVRFRRTTDRTIGDAISWLSLMLLAAAWIKSRPQFARANSGEIYSSRL